MSNTSLFSLFMPPKGYFGDFGLLCGFTASREVLDRLKRSFSGDVTRPVLAAFIHPSINSISDIPGLAWMWMYLDARRDYNLLHAKIALLGFRKSDGSGYLIRLAVSTGNWTSDPLTTSIDLFWHVDLETSSGDLSDVACADILAAWDYFEWLRKRADCSIIECEFDGRRPDAFLEETIKKLPQTDTLPRFIDNRKAALSEQVVERFLSSAPHNRLIIGSGYYEEANENKSVPERLYETLVSKQSLRAGSICDLFLNPDSCQGFHLRGKELDEGIWRLRKPKALFEGQNKLHAKFVMIASDDKSADGQVVGKLYLGSGNLSRTGFEKSAADRGNIEAGVVFDLPSGLRWDARGRNSIQKHLPIAFHSTIKPGNLQNGGAFETPDEPASIPPIPYLIWENQRIKTPTNQHYNIKNQEGCLAVTPCEWPTTPPRVVELVEEGQSWFLPVWADGVLVAPKITELTAEDLLVRLVSFPEMPDLGDDDGVDEEDGNINHNSSSNDRINETTVYAIRRMMELLVQIAEVQRHLDPRDWQRWCRELRENLIAIYGQEKMMINFFRNAEANPLFILLDPRMRPADVQFELLKKALESITAHWELQECTSLWRGYA